MKVFIDIGHPAHVHYFRNLIIRMTERGHSFFVTARNKEMTHELLNKYNIPFTDRGTGSNHFFGKFFYLLLADIKLLRLAIEWKPDVFLSFGSPYAAHTAKMLKKPHIAMTDTEHAKLGLLSFAPFSDCMIVPESFYKFDHKQIRFNGFFELCYLHPALYKHDYSVRSLLNLSRTDKFVLLRFVSWNATHDLGESGISDQTKLKLISILTEKGYKIFISSEGIMIPELRKYKIVIPPEKIHSALYEADLFIGESGTMVSEASMLGTPSVYVNSLDAGVFHDEARYGLLYSMRSDKKLINVIKDLLSVPDLKEIHRKRKEKMLSDKINVTPFLVWFVENYPESRQIMMTKPDYQYIFR
jgi:uncharacterized protein